MGSGTAFSVEVEDQLEASMHRVIEERQTRRAALRTRNKPADVAARPSPGVGTPMEDVQSALARGQAAMEAFTSENRARYGREVSLSAARAADLRIVPADVYGFYSPPYEMQNTNGDTFGTADQWENVPDKNSGAITIAQHCVTHSSGGWGWAGVGFWYVPRTQIPGMVEFRALIHWQYAYALDAEGLDAHSAAEVGLDVFSWDMNGEDMKTQTVRSPLWDYRETGVHFGSPHRDSNDGTTNLVNPFSLEPGRRYACWAYVLASTDASGSQGVFAGSEGTTDVWAQMPFFVTEEWGINIQA